MSFVELKVKRLEYLQTEQSKRQDSKKGVGIFQLLARPPGARMTTNDVSHVGQGDAHGTEGKARKLKGPKGSRKPSMRVRRSKPSVRTLSSG